MFSSLFPSYVYQAPLKARGLEKLNQELLKESYKIREIDASGKEWSKTNYPGGYTSYGSMSELHQFSTTFETLRNHIDGHVASFVKHSEMDIKPHDLKMRSCWVNIMAENVLHSMHLHPLSVISGTYYVKTPKGTPGLKFEDPRLGFFMASPPRKFNAKAENQRFVTLKPQVGQVILFESWMKHEVPVNTVDIERVSISFNYDWVP